MAKKPQPKQDQVPHTIAEQYANYLVLMGLEEHLMHPTQRVQLKESFYAAAGMFYLLIHQIGGNMKQEEADSVLNGIDKEITEFWKGIEVKGEAEKANMPKLTLSVGKYNIEAVHLMSTYEITGNPEMVNVGEGVTVAGMFVPGFIHIPNLTEDEHKEVTDWWWARPGKRDLITSTGTFIGAQPAEMSETDAIISYDKWESNRK